METNNKKPEISVIIPTFNRSGVLKECLERLTDQKFSPQDYEIIVVDDGSTDDTKKVVEKAAKKNPVRIIYLYQKNQGQGIARNYALRYAKGRIIVFIHDDVMVLTDFLRQHLKFHLKYPYNNATVLGLVSWDPRLELTPLRSWLTGEYQFSHEKLSGRITADYNFFSSKNISIKRDVLKKHPYDARFSAYPWEDFELGYRLYKKEGLIVYFNPMSIGYHYHQINENDYYKTVYLSGKYAYLIYQRYPELNFSGFGLKNAFIYLFSNKFSLFLLKKCFTNHYYSILYRKNFLKGLSENKRTL